MFRIYYCCSPDIPSSFLLTSFFSSSSTHIQYDHHFFKKVPHGAEAVNILVGETTFLPHPVAAFVRLREACRLGEMTEVPVPTRFLFILLGTAGNGAKYQQIGRAVGTLFSDEVGFFSLWAAIDFPPKYQLGEREATKVHNFPERGRELELVGLRIFTMAG